MPINVAINGFGRIGRATFKAILERFPKKINVVALNDLTDAPTLAHLLQYDTVYGKYQKKLRAAEKAIYVDNKKYPVFSEKDPTLLPWAKLKVDVVVESTGVFRTKDQASMHLQAGAKKVLISAPAKSGDVGTFIVGVNENKIKTSDKIISNASCTTNCIAPVIHALHRKFGVRKAFMTTIHAYTADQSLVDGPHKDYRRARAAAQNIVPTTTGAAIATTEIIPSLNNRFDGISIRVPVVCGSLSDFTMLLNKKTTVEELNNYFIQVEKNDKNGILKTSTEPLVSSDIIGNPASTIVDLGMTKVLGGDFVKVLAWYDNEWGYSVRMAEIIADFAKK